MPRWNTLPARGNPFSIWPCDGDAGLRRQVEDLLSREGRAGSFQEVPAMDDTIVTPAAGSVLAGNYRILSPRGAGGRGEVYCPHDGKHKSGT